MTLIYELDLDIMEMYLYAKSEVPSSKHSKVTARTDGQTDRHTHTHTQTDANENITYPHAGGDNANLFFQDFLCIKGVLTVLLLKNLCQIEGLQPQNWYTVYI